ncbi:MAG TPA: hypothetical protein VGC47_12070 [Acidimicrobiia bacterium]|jgi:hypothetical protein
MTDDPMQEEPRQEEPPEEEPKKPPPIPGRILDIVDDLLVMVEEARPVPLSSAIRIDRDQLISRLHELQEILPDELRAARWMVRQRETYVARTNEKARTMLAKAKAKSEDLVADSHIVQEAVEEANRLVRNAEKDAERIRLEAEDHAERRLAEAEAVLGELLRYVQEARAELHEALPAPIEAPVGE